VFPGDGAGTGDSSLTGPFKPEAAPEDVGEAAPEDVGEAAGDCGERPPATKKLITQLGTLVKPCLDKQLN
jgi:hypothetical protein